MTGPTRGPSRSRRLATLVGGLVLVAALSACGSSGGALATPTTKQPTTPATPKKVNPYYDSGSVVTITPTGFQPKELVATVKVPVRFVNDTNSVQRVQFEHSRGTDGQLIRSGSIAPGATWSYTPENWESATYHSITRPALRGQIQIQPPAEP